MSLTPQEIKKAVERLRAGNQMPTVHAMYSADGGYDLYPEFNAEILAALAAQQPANGNGHVTKPAAPTTEVRETAPNAPAEQPQTSERPPHATMTPVEGALMMAAHGIPQILLRPYSKAAFESNWQNDTTNTKLTTDPNIIRQHNGNFGTPATGKPDGIWMFEADSTDVFERIKKETGHDIIAETNTFLVRSRQGRGHVYFRNTPAALAMGNLPQAYVKSGDFSVRVNNHYVVSAGSIHPETKQPYECLTPNVAPVPAPDWFVEWLLAQRMTAKTSKGEAAIPVSESGKIPHGYIHGWMVKKAGILRNGGLAGAELESALLAMVHASCEPPIDDDKVRQVARSFEKYEPQPSLSLPLELNQTADPPEMPNWAAMLPPYPAFPTYVFAGTSVYENFVKPWCDHNSRIDYFMWLPAMAMLSNYLGTKIQLKSRFAQKALNLSQYVVLIGDRGDTNKSSCIDDAMQYFNYIGCLAHNSGGIKTADGKTVVWTAGSIEGLGIEMQKLNCKNALLLYDELSQLVKKAGIDGSNLSSQLLTLYESKKFGNSIKNPKQAFSIDPGTYVFSLITGCTPETFHDLWSKMNGEDTGMNDRTVFVLQPETLPKRRMKEEVNALEGAAKTRQLMDKAVQQGVFEIKNWDNAKLQSFVDLGYGDRFVARAIKWALAIAVDLGLGIIDDECIDRGCDIVRYELAVKDWLRADQQAETPQARMQLKINDVLWRNGGSMTERELKTRCNAYSRGTFEWNNAFNGLVAAGVIELRKGDRADSRMVYLMQDIGARFRKR